MVIKRVGPLSCAKIVGTLHIFVGLLVGAIFSLAAMAGAFASDRTEAPFFIGAFIGVGSIIFFPVLYGCIGFISTLVGAWLYNVVAGFVGGIEMDVQ
jgi:hypothetical protein